MKTLAALFLAAGTLAAEAQTPGLQRGGANGNDKLVLNNGEEVVLPRCVDPKGTKVRYVMARRENEQLMPGGPLYNQWSILAAYQPKDGPQILMRPSLLDLPRQTLQFVVEHECAHHTSGDILGQFVNTYKPGTYKHDPHAMEYQSDCTAAKAVEQKFGYKADDIRVAFSVFPPHDNSPTHPPTAERVKRAIACIANP